MITESTSAFVFWEILAVLVGALASYLAVVAQRLNRRGKPVAPIEPPNTDQASG